MQSEDPNVLNATGDDRPDETTEADCHPPTARNRSGTGVRADRHKRDPGTVGADAAPVQGQPARLDLQSGSRLKPFSFGLTTPLDSRPPLPRTQPGADFPSQ